MSVSNQVKVPIYQAPVKVHLEKTQYLGLLQRKYTFYCQNQENMFDFKKNIIFLSKLFNHFCLNILYFSELS